MQIMQIMPKSLHKVCKKSAKSLQNICKICNIHEQNMHEICNSDTEYRACPPPRPPFQSGIGGEGVWSKVLYGVLGTLTKHSLLGLQQGGQGYVGSKEESGWRGGDSLRRSASGGSHQARGSPHGSVSQDRNRRVGHAHRYSSLKARLG